MPTAIICEYTFALSIPADFVDDVPDLTNLDTSSIFVVISLSRSLVILASVFGFNTFPVSADIHVV
jgi:hypothetical protein